MHGMGSINWCKMCGSQIVLVESRFRFQCQHGFQNSLTRKWFQFQHVFQLIIMVHLRRENMEMISKQDLRGFFEVYLHWQDS